MPELGEIIKLVVLYGIGIIIPGPGLVLVLNYALSYSKRVAMIGALGIAVGTIIHSTYIILGVGTVIINSLFLTKCLYMIGGVYLCYLGYGAISAKTDLPVQNSEHKVSNRITSHKAFVSGMITCLINPKAIFFLTTIYTSVVTEFHNYIMNSIYQIIIALETIVSTTKIGQKRQRA